MSSIRLVVSDVDGTLVTHDKQLTPAAITAVHKLHTRGIPFTAVSSRPPFGMRMLTAPLKLMLPMGAFNGSTIFNPDLSLVEQHNIPRDAVDVALEMLTACGAEIWLFTNDRWLVTRDDTPYVTRERRTVDATPQIVDDVTPYLGDICKITIYLTDPRYREAVYRVVGKWLKGVFPVSTGIVVSALARPEWLVEIDGTAVIPD